MAGNPYIQLYPLEYRQQYAARILELPNKIPVIVTCSEWYSTQYECLIMDSRHTIQDILHAVGCLDKYCCMDYFTKQVLGTTQKLETFKLNQDQNLYIHIGQIFV